MNIDPVKIRLRNHYLKIGYGEMVKFWKEVDSWLTEHEVMWGYQNDYPSYDSERFGMPDDIFLDREHAVALTLRFGL